MKAKTAQKEVAGEVFNPDESGSSRPTARGSERIRRGDKFMPECTLEEMAKYVSGLGEGKERSVGIACVKRKEGKIMETISKEMLKPPSTIQRLAGQGAGIVDCTVWPIKSRRAVPPQWAAK